MEQTSKVASTSTKEVSIPSTKLALNEGGNGMFDTLGFIRNLRSILCTISVRGETDVHNMDLVISGLKVLHNNLAKERDAEEE
jgi:hypothetical protein